MHPQPQLVLSGSALHQQQQQQQPICQSAATCSSGLVPLPSFAVPNDNITQSPTVLQADLRPPHSSMGAVSVLSPGVAALGPSSTTSLQMLATTGNWGSEATPSASQHNVLLQPVSVNSTLKPPQRTSLTMSSPSVDPSCSPGQHDSVMQPMLGGPSSSPAQDLARDPSRSPMLSPSQRLSLQPVIGSPSLDPRQRLYVAQRVKELQSHAGSPLSPERSASSSSMLAAMLSPRSGDRRGGSASPKADHASQIAAPASPHHSVHPPTVLSSPSRGMHSRPDRPHAASTHGSNSNRHDTTTRHADVADRATFNRSDSAAGSSSGQLTATPAARDGSFGTQPVEQSQRSATGGDFKQGVESDMMHESSPGYELPPDAMPVAEAEDGRRADRLETSSGAVELQYDDDTDSAVNPGMHCLFVQSRLHTGVLCLA